MQHRSRAHLPAILRRFAFLVASLILGGTINGECQGQPSVTASFALRDPTVTLHEPVVADLSVRNGSPQEVTVDLGYDREGSLEFSILQPDDSTVTPPRLPNRNGISRSPQFTLAPGRTYRQELLLNKWYSFNKTGNYRILVRLAMAIQTDSGVPTKTKFSQKLTLQVGARDEQRLQKVCEGLAAASMGTNAEASLNAARSLSYVDDMIAVPYLARLTKQGPYVVVTRNIALQGLGRIARLEGPEAVLSRLSPEDRKWETVIRAEAQQ